VAASVAGATDDRDCCHTKPPEIEHCKYREYG